MPSIIKLRPIFIISIIALASVGSVQLLAAEENDLIHTSLGFEIYGDPNLAAFGPVATMELQGGLFSGLAGLRFVGDGKEQGTEGWMGDLLYFDLLENWVKLEAQGLSITGGYRPLVSRLSANPYYSLIDNNGKLGIGLDIAYNGELFSYATQWTQLNYQSKHRYGYTTLNLETSQPNDANTRWADRSLYTKTLSFNLGDFTFGYAESTIAFNRYFDLNSWLNPIPSIVLNTLWANQTDNPWASYNNDASFMSVFMGYQGEQLSLEMELLAKDLNVSVLGGPDNVNRLAFSAGASYRSTIGNFGLWSGLALKHMYGATYQPSGIDSAYPYQYTYYPVSTLKGRDIAPEDNYIGNPNGENSFSIQLDYGNLFQLSSDLSLNVYGALEVALIGAQSLENPWHNETWVYKPVNQLFDNEDVLEKKLLFSTEVEAQWRTFFANLDLRLGASFDARKLTPSTDGGPAIWQPTQGEQVLRNAVALTIGYRLSF